MKYLKLIICNIEKTFSSLLQFYYHLLNKQMKNWTCYCRKSFTNTTEIFLKLNICKNIINSFIALTTSSQSAPNRIQQTYISIKLHKESDFIPLLLFILMRRSASFPCYICNVNIFQFFVFIVLFFFLMLNRCSANRKRVQTISVYYYTKQGIFASEIHDLGAKAKHIKNSNLSYLKKLHL